MTKTLSVSAHTRRAPQRQDKLATPPHIELRSAQIGCILVAELERVLLPADDGMGRDVCPLTGGMV